MIPLPDGDLPEGKKIVQVEVVKLISGALLSGAISMLAIVNHTLVEGLREVPRPDWIEIRVIRYDVVDEEGTDERDVSPAPPGE
jgi:hypothetical protein